MQATASPHFFSEGIASPQCVLSAHYRILHCDCEFSEFPVNSHMCVYITLNFPHTPVFGIDDVSYNMFAF